MANTYAQAIQPTPALPPVYSLLTAAHDATAEVPGYEWGIGGARWLPELTATASESGASVIDCIGDTVTTALTSAAAASIVERKPVAVWATDKCSASGYKAADYAGRALRKLLAVQSYWVAKELWSGAQNTAGTLGNVNLNSTASDEMTTAAVTTVLGFGRIEQGIAYYGHGRRGMIHCTPQALFDAHVAYGLDKSPGGLWLTPMGNIVVADAGYDGSAPGGTAASTTQWIYGTEVLDYLLSPVVAIPTVSEKDDPEEFMRQTLDRTTNTVVAQASRSVLVRWDGQIHVAAEISLTVPTIGGN